MMIDLGAVAYQNVVITAVVLSSTPKKGTKYDDGSNNSNDDNSENNFNNDSDDNKMHIFVDFGSANRLYARYWSIL